jgi:hypothetical protein
MKQLYSHLAVQPQIIAVPHVLETASHFLHYISENNSLFRRQEPTEEGFPAAFRLLISSLDKCFPGIIHVFHKSRTETQTTEQEVIFIQTL